MNTPNDGKVTKTCKDSLAVLRTDPNPSYGHLHTTLPLAGNNSHQLVYSLKKKFKACVWFAIADMERDLEGAPNSRSVFKLIFFNYQAFPLLSCESDIIR